MGEQVGGKFLPHQRTPPLAGGGRPLHSGSLVNFLRQWFASARKIRRVTAAARRDDLGGGDRSCVKDRQHRGDQLEKCFMVGLHGFGLVATYE